ncbi:MAG TPA: 2-phospho-L-lactate guanylyltransferase [Sphingomonas sp.]|nr:2-phospho-L-lactate guanylyltransferase [Sphingomonas sp.]
MIWSALVPLKPPASRKGRLASRLSPTERERLSRYLFERTIATLCDVPAIGAIHLLSADRPEGWTGAWHRDEGRGLNAELEAARAALGSVPLLVIHADLPLVARADIEALLERAEERGCALAPDRHGEGTNAVALMPGGGFRFAFGPGSYGLHHAQAPHAARVEREGLALDCDTPDDLDRALAAGFLLPREP